MKTKTLPLLLLMSGLIHTTLGQAPFTSGSTGADGALNVTANLTLDLPPDGIFHFTTITVASGATLRFNRNALNTPVYLLAAGDVVINGTIDVSGEHRTGSAPGKGGPGGFDGGFRAFQGFPSGDGFGPGGGKFVGPNVDLIGQGGVYSTSISFNTNIYGNTLLSPLIGGSGGAANINGSDVVSGAGGGGAIMIASSSRITLSGKISGRGGDNFSGGGGSGGAIRLVAPVVDGSGSLDVIGGYTFEPIS